MFAPGIELKITSNYMTLDKDKKALCILKLQTISNVDLTLDDVIVNATLENGKTYKMVPYSFRMKGVIFRMVDIKNQTRDYKLLKALEPNLIISGIKQGSNECYLGLKSAESFEDNPIKSWSFELKYRQHMLPIPNLPFLNRKTITVIPPPREYTYFDDLLFQKISREERQKLLDEL